MKNHSGLTGFQPLPGSNALIARRHFRRLGSEIALVDDAVLIDDERHHAAFAVFGGVREQCEAGDHAAVDHVVVSAAGRVRALLRQDPEVVAAIRISVHVALEVGRGLGDQRSERALLFVLGRVRRPVQAVVLAGRAGELLRVLQHAVAIAILRCKRALRVDVGAEHIDGIALVAADATVDQFLDALLRCEAPAVAGLHERDRERPRLVADDEHTTVWTRLLEDAQRLHRREDPRTVRARRRAIGIDDDVLVLVAEDREQLCVGVCLQCRRQRVDRLVRRRECLRGHRGR